MKRLIVHALALVLLAGVLLGAWAAWKLWPRTTTYYTDADAIRADTRAVSPRDVLWQPPTSLAELNTGDDDSEPSIAADGQTLVFARGRAGGNADLYVSRRGPDGEWLEPRPLSEINSDYDELGPALSPDGRTLYFYSDRPGCVGGYDIWLSRRTDEGWMPPVNAGGEVNSSFNEVAPALAPDARRLYFASNRPAAESDAAATQPASASEKTAATQGESESHYDLYASAIRAGTLAPAESLAPVNSTGDESSPAISPYGDFLYFASNRAGGLGGFDLYRARLVEGVLQRPEHLGRDINSPANELDPEPHMGGFALCFTSDRASNASDAAPNATPDYNLYLARSREVFQQAQTQRGHIDWAELWRQIAPNLLWAALAFLLILLFLALMRDFRERQIGLLTKCLLASLFVHLLLMLLFNVWQVTTTLADAMGGRSRLQVALVSSAAGSEITEQIRGSLTQTADVAPVETLARSEFSPATETPADAPMEQVQVARGEAGIVEHATLSPAPPADTMPDSEILPPSEVPAAAESVPLDVADMSVASPAPPTPAEGREAAAQAPQTVNAAAMAPAAPDVTAPAAEPIEPAEVTPQTLAAGELTKNYPSGAAAARADDASPADDVSPEALAVAPAEAAPLTLDDLAAPAAANAVAREEASPASPSQLAFDAPLPAINTPTSQPANDDFGDTVAVSASTEALQSSGSAAQDMDASDAPARANFEPARIDDGTITDAPAALASALRLPEAPAAPDGSGEEPSDALVLAAATADSPRPALPTTADDGPTGSAAAEYIAPDAGNPLAEATPPAPLHVGVADATFRGPAPPESRPAEPISVAIAMDIAAPAPARSNAPGSGEAEDNDASANPASASLDTPRLAAIGDSTSADAPPELRLPPRPFDAEALTPPGAAPLPAAIDAGSSDLADDPRPSGDSPAVDAPPALLALGLPAETEPPPSVAIVHGRVSDARTGEPLQGAAVRLVRANEETLEVQTGPDGAYRLEIPPVPDNFALSASAADYVPHSLNIAAADVARGPVRADFRLEPRTEMIVALEDEPDVHHLGNDRFEGVMNSQFQKLSEGTVHRANFELTAAQLQTVARAEVHLLARGVQCPHVLRINGHLVDRRLRSSPADGSYGEFSAEFDPAFLKPGRNIFKITAKECRGDLDDFEFVNVRIRLYTE